MNKFVEHFLKLNGIDPDQIPWGFCVLCGKEARHFDDEASRREYNISRMCQECQDEAFSEENILPED